MVTITMSDRFIFERVLNGRFPEKINAKSLFSILVIVIQCGSMWKKRWKNHSFLPPLVRKIANLHRTACTPIGYLGGQEGMKFYSEKYNFWIVYHYQVITKTFSWKNEYKIFFRLEDMAQNGPEYPICVSNSGKNLFPLKIQDNHALLQPKLVFLGSLAIWDDSNRYCFHKIIRLLRNAAKYCKNAAK